MSDSSQTPAPDESIAIAQAVADIATEQHLLDTAHSKVEQMRVMTQQFTSAIEAEHAAEAIAFERIKMEGKVSAETLRHDRLETQLAQAIENRIAAERALEQAAQERQQADAQAAQELAFRIENDARVLDAMRARIATEASAIEAEKQRVEREQQSLHLHDQQSEAEAEADRLMRERMEGDQQALESFRLRKKADLEAKANADARAEADKKLMSQSQLLIDAEREAAEAATQRLEAENSAARIEREKLDIEAELTQHNKVRIELERKADAAAQERILVVEELQIEMNAQRAAAHEAGMKREQRLQIEWQAFCGSLRVMGRYWLAGMSLLLVLLGCGLGFLMAWLSVDTQNLPEMAMTVPEASPAEGRLDGNKHGNASAIPPSFSASLYEGKESERLTDMPLGMRFDEGFHAFGVQNPSQTSQP